MLYLTSLLLALVCSCQVETSFLSLDKSISYLKGVLFSLYLLVVQQKSGQVLLAFSTEGKHKICIHE